MKKQYKISILLIIIVIIVSGVFYFNNKENETNDSVYFSELYNISKDNVFKEISAEDANDLIENRTGIIYIGYKDCPWCQDLVPILNESAKENNIKTIYYIDNFKDMRPDKNDKPINQNEYKKLVKLLGNEIVEMHNDQNEYDIIRVPLVLFIKNGEIVDYHKGTYEGHELKEKEENGNKTYYLDELTQKQKDEIKEVLNNKFKKVYSNRCNNSGC